MPKNHAGPLYRWHFTLWEMEEYWAEAVKIWMKEFCKKWVFQQERAPNPAEDNETDGLHYQGKFALKEKMRLKQVKDALGEIGANIHLSPEHGTDEEGNFYCTKEETRVAGPWSDRDAGNRRYPKQWATLPHMQWHDTVIDLLEAQDSRHMLLVIDKVGESGKTVLTKRLMMSHGATALMTCLPTGRDTVRAAMNACNHPDPDHVYTLIFDIPRSGTRSVKDFWSQILTAMETIKDGLLADDRYSYKSKLIAPPRILVFTNEMPPVEGLARNRWQIFDLQTWVATAPASLEEPDEGVS